MLKLVKENHEVEGKYWTVPTFKNHWNAFFINRELNCGVTSIRADTHLKQDKKCEMEPMNLYPQNNSLKQNCIWHFSDGEELQGGKKEGKKRNSMVSKIPNGFSSTFYLLKTKWQQPVRDTGRSHYHTLTHASATCAEQREANREQRRTSSSFVSSLHPVPQNWTIPGAISGKRFSHSWRKTKMTSLNKHHMVTGAESSSQAKTPSTPIK